MTNLCHDCKRPVGNLAGQCPAELLGAIDADHEACLRSQLSAANAKVAELEALVAKADALCVAAIRCGVHTWTNIPPEAAPRAVEFGTRMFEYFNASPTCDWPMDDTNVKNAVSPLLKKGGKDG